MKMPEPKYEFWKEYFILDNNKIKVFKAVKVVVSVEDSGSAPKQVRITYDGFIDGNRADIIPEYRIFATKEDLLKSL